MSVKISIIIPTYNEERYISILLDHLLPKIDENVEILVSDGGSKDATADEVYRPGATLLISEKKGRAAQMNFAAARATGDILYFLHADSLPPDHFVEDIRHSFAAGTDAGCYRLKFDFDHWFLKLNAWFTRFNVNYFRFGDQSLFISRSLFEKIGGYRNDHLLMEDQEIVHRIRKAGRFKVMKGEVVTSARKYLVNGPFKLQYTFFLIWLNYYLGRKQEKLVRLYRKRIKDIKIDN